MSEEQGPNSWIIVSLLDKAFFQAIITSFPARGVAIDGNGSVYVSDSGNHRIVKWMVNATEGIVIFGGNGNGSRTDQLTTSGGIVLDENGTLYVADENNQRILSIVAGARNGTIIAGGHGQGGAANQLNNPISLAFNGQKDLYVSDSNNFRVQMFEVSKSPSSGGDSSYIGPTFSKWILISHHLCMLITFTSLLV